jgi:hypothetical protein
VVRSHHAGRCVPCHAYISGKTLQTSPCRRGDFINIIFWEHLDNSRLRIYMFSIDEPPARAITAQSPPRSPRSCCLRSFVFFNRSCHAYLRYLRWVSPCLAFCLCDKLNSCYRLQFSYDMACIFLEKGANHFLWEKVQVAPKTIKKYY